MPANQKPKLSFFFFQAPKLIFKIVKLFNILSFLNFGFFLKSRLIQKFSHQAYVDTFEVFGIFKVLVVFETMCFLTFCFPDIFEI